MNGQVLGSKQLVVRLHEPAVVDAAKRSRAGNSDVAGTFIGQDCDDDSRVDLGHRADLDDGGAEVLDFVCTVANGSECH